MRLKQSIFACLLAGMVALPALSATITVAATATPDAGLFDYSYSFAVSGTAASVDSVYLGSDDLSPLNLVIEVDGNPTSAWSWLGNDTPRNYLQFFDFGGTSLGSGDVLDVTFSSALAPAAAYFAEGFSSLTSNVTNIVDGVLGPAAVTSSPEPASLFLLAGCAAFVSIGRRWQKKSC